MKYCGCNNCRLNGERNLVEEFELYCSTRELEDKAIFENIFKSSYTISEMEKLYADLEPEFSGVSRVVARINMFTMLPAPEFNAYDYWSDYGNPTES